MQASLFLETDNSLSFKGFMDSLHTGIKKHLGESVFFAWFKDINFKSYDGEKMLLSVKNEKIKNCIFLHYQAKFERIVEKTFSKQFKKKLQSFDIIIEKNECEEKAESLSVNPIILEQSKFNIKIPLDKKFTFKNFVEMEENKLAVGLAKHIVNVISSNQSNILHFSKKFCICGSIGNGKTHLAQAIGNEVSSSGFDVIYTTAERFLFNFQTAVKKNETVDFAKSFLNTKLLIVDDIHFIATKKKTIEELYKVSYSIIANGGLVLFCSSSQPFNLPIELKGVKDFFSSSHLVNIANPSESLRYQILKTKLSQSSYRVSDSLLKILASKIQNNIRDLEGAMGRIVLHSQILNYEIDEESSNFISTEIFPHKELKKVSIDEIQKKVAKHFGISISEIKSRKRTKVILKTRQIAIYLASQLSVASYVEIGKLFNRTHSTVIHSIKTIKKEINNSRSFKEEVNYIKAFIEQEI
jgi:chromosomal replication initiator protein